MQKLTAAVPAGGNASLMSTRIASGINDSRFENDDLGVSFYSETPHWEVSVREFEELTCDRLKVLHAFDRICAYDASAGSLARVEELKGKVAPEIKNANLNLPVPTPGRYDEFPAQKEDFMRRDCISHFALRVAFCKTRDAREWFLRQEQRLFVLRFDAMSTAAQEQFLIRSGMPCKKFEEVKGVYPSLDDLQKTTYGAKLYTESSDGKKSFDFEKNFYEMPFFDVAPHLISARKVVIHQGTAYVPASALKLILTQRVKDQLLTGLDNSLNALPNVLSNPSVGGFLRILQEHGLQLLVAPKSSSSDAPGEKLSLDNFEELLMRSFSPCMRRLVEAQRDMKKHLKHSGRLQLRPFLKECGFTMDESLRWWRQELMRDSTIDVTTFEKNYTYDVEHTYGKKGSFQGQSCFGCPKIIGFPGETAGQVHGCPFKMEMSLLKQQLHRWKMPESGVAEVEKLIKNGNHYQLACIEYFKSQHPGHSGDGVGNSPGNFFKESCAHHLKLKEKESGKSPSKSQSDIQPSQAVAA